MVYSNNSDCWVLLVKLVSLVGSACKKPMRQGFWCNVVIGKGVQETLQMEKGDRKKKDGHEGSITDLSTVIYKTAQGSDPMGNAKKLHRTVSESFF